MDKKRFWPFLCLLPLIAAAVAGWSMLPDTLVVHIGLDGQPSNHMPKLVGVLLPVALGAIGAGIACDPSKEKKVSGFAVLAAAVIVTILTFAMNL